MHQDKNKRPMSQFMPSVRKRTVKKTTQRPMKPAKKMGNPHY